MLGSEINPDSTGERQALFYSSKSDTLTVLKKQKRAKIRPKVCCDGSEAYSVIRKMTELTETDPEQRAEGPFLES